MPLGLFGGSKKKKQKEDAAEQQEPQQEPRDGNQGPASSSSSSSSSSKKKLSKREKKELKEQSKREKKEKKQQSKREKKEKKQQSKKSKNSKNSKPDKAEKKGKHPQRRMGAQKVHRGRLFLRLTIEGDKLYAKVEEARDFHRPTKADDANPYVVLTVAPAPKAMDAADAKQRTRILKGARKRANFEEMFKFDITSVPQGARDNTRLRLELRHDTGKKKGQVLGCMAFTLMEIQDDDTPTHGWFRFLDEKKGVNQNEPFRVMRKQEITKEIQEIYGTYGNFGGQKDEVNKREAGGEEAVDDANLITSETAGSAAPAKTVGIGSFNYLQVLGRGAFGKVLLAEMKGGSDIYAVKILSKEAVVEDDDVDATMIERRVLSVGGECPCLTSLIATFQTPDRLYFVMEFIKGGDLMFHASCLGSFTEPQAQLLLAEVSCGLWFLHERGILYRDLKLDNVMLTGDGHAKLADFGLCKEGIWGAATTTTFCGTPGYVAPEIIQELPYGVSVDWWSLGVMAYEMLQGASPFDGDDEEEIFDAVLHNPVEFDTLISPHARSYLTSLLERDPRKRLGCGSSGKDDIQSHPFFKDIDWDKAAAHELEPRYKPPGSGDTDNFDEEFTAMTLENTPVEEDVIADLDQDLFDGFTFVAGSALDDNATRPPLQEYPWYRPDLNRKTAEAELLGSEVGRFIVRESGSQPGCYAISVKFQNRCWHGVITPGKTLSGETYYKLYQKHKFADVPSLVEFYHRNAIARDSNKQHVVLVFDDEDDE